MAFIVTIVAATIVVTAVVVMVMMIVCSVFHPFFLKHAVFSTIMVSKTFLVFFDYWRIIAAMPLT